MGIGVVFAQGNAEGATGGVGGLAQGQQNVGGFQGAAAAGATAAGGDALQVEAQQDGLALNALKREVDIVGQPFRGVAVEDAVRNPAGNFVNDAVAQDEALGADLLPVGVGQLQGYGQANDAGDVLGAGAPLPFLAAAGDEGQERHAAPEEQDANALGAVKFVPGEAHHIDAQAAHVKVEETGGLHGVGMHHDAAVEFLRPLLHGGGDFGNGVDGANLIVGVHYGNNGGLAGDGVIDSLRVNLAVVINGQAGYVPTAVFQYLASVQYGVVFGAGRDDVAAGFLQRVGGAPDGGVVGLGAAAGEYHLAVAAVERFGHALAGGVQSVAGFLPDGVDAGGVAVELGEIGQHRLEHALVHRRGAGVVKVDVVLGGHSSVPMAALNFSIPTGRNRLAAGRRRNRFCLPVQCQRDILNLNFGLARYYIMPVAEINGYRMHYTVIGDDDAPPLALIHGGLGGGDGSKDTINRQAAALSAEYRCLFYDRRACGQSDAPAGGYDIPNCALDLRELLAHLGIEKAHILGSSAGGPIAMQFALDYPELTDTLILVNTMTYSQEAQREVRRQELQRLKERIASEGRAAAAERALSERFPQLAADDPERFARIVQENLGRIDGIAATQQAYLDIGDSLESRLGELQMPVTIVHGDQDSRIPIACGYVLNDKIRDRQMYIISGAEHGLMTNEAADRTREMIMMRLRGVQKTREAEAWWAEEQEREKAEAEAE